MKQQLENEFCAYCHRGKLKELKSFLKKEIFKSLSSEETQTLINKGFLYAAQNQQLEMMLFLLNDEKLKYHADIHYDDDIALRDACAMDNIKTTEFLLTCEKLNEHANLNANNYESIRYACINDNLEIVKLIFSLPNIHISDFDFLMEDIFLHLKERNSTQVAQYLLIDLGLEVKDNFKSYIDNWPEGAKLLNSRELHDDLKNNLSQANKLKKTNKI